MAEQMLASQLDDLRFQLKWARAIAKQLKTWGCVNNDGDVLSQKTAEAVVFMNNFCSSVDHLLNRNEGGRSRVNGSSQSFGNAGDADDAVDNNSDVDEGRGDASGNDEDDGNLDADDERDEETGDEENIFAPIRGSVALGEPSVLHAVGQSEYVIPDQNGRHEAANAVDQSTGESRGFDPSDATGERAQPLHVQSSQDQPAVNSRIIESFVASPEQDVPEANECETRCPEFGQLNGMAMDGLECNGLDFSSRYSTEIVHEVPMSVPFTRPDEENLDYILDGISTASRLVAKTIDQEHVMGPVVVNNEYVIPLKRANHMCNCCSRLNAFSRRDDNKTTGSNRKKLLLRANPGSDRCDFSLSLPVRTCGSSVEVEFEDDAVMYSYICGQQRYTVTCSFSQKAEAANLKRQAKQLDESFISDNETRKKKRIDDESTICEPDHTEASNQNIDTLAGNWGYR